MAVKIDTPLRGGRLTAGISMESSMLKWCATCQIKYKRSFYYCTRCGNELVLTKTGIWAQRVKRGILVVLVSGLAYVLFSAYQIVSHKESNALEWSYYGLALASDNIDLCYKISPDAMSFGGIEHPWSMDAFRSICIFRVAYGTQNIALCDKVEPVRNILIGSKFTPDTCRDYFKHNMGRVVADYDRELLMLLAGYSCADVMKFKSAADGLGIDAATYHSFYLESRKPEFRSRLAVLPDFSRSDKEAREAIFTRAPECKNNFTERPLCVKIHCAFDRNRNKGPLDPKCVRSNLRQVCSTDTP